MASTAPNDYGDKPTADTEAFIRGLPKTDLHMHLEGSIEPELMMELAARHGVKLRWNTAKELRAAYEFENLQSFLDLYFEGCKVLLTARDFYDMTFAYLRRAHEQDGVVRAEMFVGPQSFAPIKEVMSGVLDAMNEAQTLFGISVGLVVSVHRHRSEEEALAVLDQIAPWKDRVVGIGMGGPEVGHPPSKFVNFYQAARERGFRTTVHAGEEGPASYVREALDLLHVERIDHGVGCVADPELVRDLAARRTPITVCPLSNRRLQVVKDLAQHPLRQMMQSGLHVTVNSDDPPYFGGYATENLLAAHDALGLTLGDVVQLVRNGFEAAWVTAEERRSLLDRLDAYVATHRELVDASS